MSDTECLSVNLEKCVDVKTLPTKMVLKIKNVVFYVVNKQNQDNKWSNVNFPKIIIIGEKNTEHKKKHYFVSTDECL